MIMKILFVAGVAVVLYFVVKNLFGTNTSDTSKSGGQSSTDSTGTSQQ